jgi:Arc/MetJ-type ribon-helix-helix transcriptional regulator
MHIEIHGETERLIRQQVCDGRFSSPEEVVKCAIRQLAQPEKGGSVTQQPRQGGYWRGQVVISSDFDQLPPDLEAAFGVTES